MEARSPRRSKNPLPICWMLSLRQSRQTSVFTFAHLALFGITNLDSNWCWKNHIELFAGTAILWFLTCHTYSRPPS